MPDVHAARRDRLRALLAAADQDAALITDLVNVRYLTGLASSNAALLVTASHALLATDTRCAVAAGEAAPDVELLIERAVAAELVKRATWLGVRRLAFESHQVTVDLHTALRRECPSTELVSVARDLVRERCAWSRTRPNFAALRQAAAIADAALADVVDGLVLGRSERHVARELERRMRCEGTAPTGRGVRDHRRRRPQLGHPAPPGPTDWRILRTGDLRQNRTSRARCSRATTPT